MLPSPIYNDRTLLFHRALKFTCGIQFCHTHRASDLQLATHYIVEQLCQHKSEEIITAMTSFYQSCHLT